MGSLNPSCKFLAILLVGLVISLTYETRTNLAVCVLAIFLTLTARGVDLKKFALALGPFILAAFGFFMTGYFFADSGREYAGSFGQSHITVASMDTAWLLGSRVLAFGSLALLFALTTQPEAFFQSLRQQLKLSPKLAYSLIAAYHFLPVVRSEYELVRAATVIRGVKVWPFSRKIMIPMLLRAFRRSECLAMAMESRGFNPAAPRGQATVIPLRLRDALFMFLPLLAAL
ncbi:MAG: energy-coupling factor transporter transmembrane protein EcfT [Deltaproteobacteria bacterium]|jgi:energy-coupling factor transporter transmembrane protein EcfT|nr:energy-coupling factor transporter transmembrane protein EcfT [Deltaproteobacteria bacterium]